MHDDKNVTETTLTDMPTRNSIWDDFTGNEFSHSDGVLFTTFNPAKIPQPAETVFIPASHVVKYTFDFRDKLIDEFPKSGWIHTNFEGSFSELNQATVGFQDLDFDHIRRILQQNEKNSKESFQAFGVTFPIETTTRWGILLVLVIQLYLWVHMREYRRRNYPESDIAWIGSYASTVPKGLFCVTALAIPIGVVTFVSVTAGLLPHMPIRNGIVCSFPHPV